MILPNFESHHLDLPKWRYKIHKTAQKPRIFALSYCSTVTGKRDLHVSWDHASATRKIGDGSLDGVAMAKLADGGSSGDTESTGVLSVMRRLDWCHR